MLIRLKHTDKAGKPEGPAMIIFDDSLQFVNSIRSTANNGVQFFIEKTDEFGHTSTFEICLDPDDINELRKFTWP